MLEDVTFMGGLVKFKKCVSIEFIKNSRVSRRVIIKGLEENFFFRIDLFYDIENRILKYLLCC